MGAANNICLLFSMILFGQSCEQYMCPICYIRVEELNVQGFSIGPNLMSSSKNIGYSKISQTQRAISPFVDGAIKQENLYRQWYGLDNKVLSFLFKSQVLPLPLLT